MAQSYVLAAGDAAEGLQWYIMIYNDGKNYMSPSEPLPLLSSNGWKQPNIYKISLNILIHPLEIWTLEKVLDNADPLAFVIGLWSFEDQKSKSLELETSLNFNHILYVAVTNIFWIFH